MTTAKDVIPLRVGDEHAVRLESLLPAGYIWEPEVEGDAEAVEVSKETPADDSSQEAFGIGVDEIFKIKAVRPGKAVVRLAQRRPWQKDAKAANEHVLELDIKA